MKLKNSQSEIELPLSELQISGYKDMQDNEYTMYNIHIVVDRIKNKRSEPSDIAIILWPLVY